MQTTQTTQTSETYNKVTIKFNKRNGKYKQTLLSCASACLGAKSSGSVICAAPSRFAQRSVFHAAPIDHLHMVHEQYAKSMVWLREGRFDWFVKDIENLYFNLVHLNYFNTEPDVVYTQHELIWLNIESFWKTGPYRSIQAVKNWLKKSYLCNDYLKYYNIDNYEKRCKEFKEWLQFKKLDEEYKKELQQDQVEILIQSPEFNPFEVDDQQDVSEQKQLIVSEELIKQEIIASGENKPTCLSLLFGPLQKEESNEFLSGSDDFDTHSQSDMDISKEKENLNDEYTVSPVSPPKQKKQLSPKWKRDNELKSEWSAEVKESDLKSPEAGVMCFPNCVFTKYTSLNDPFVYYTSPPGYPYVKPKKSPHQPTPLQHKNIDLSCTDKTKKWWNKKTFEDNFRFTPKYRKWVGKMKAKAQAKVDHLNKKPDDDKKDPDAIPLTVAIIEPVQKEPENLDKIAKQFEFARKLSMPPIMLAGGMKQAMPPHLRQVQRHIADAPHSSIGSWFHRNVQHREYRRGAGVVEHRYYMQTPEPFPVTPALAHFAARIANFAAQHACECTHRNYGGGFTPRLQYVFRQARGGAYRRSKIANMRNVQALELLLGNLYQDEQQIYGSDPFSPDDDVYMHALHVLVPEHEYDGGCDSDYHTINNGDYKIKTVKSKNNNCGIACLLFHTKINTQQNTIRKRCGIEMERLLNFGDLEKVAFYLDVGFRIWLVDAGILSVTKSYGLDKENVTDILYNAVTKHYSVLQLQNQKKQCTLCGAYIRNKNKHICNANKIQFYRKFKNKSMNACADFKPVTEEPQDYNNVYIFDLETFPEHEDKVHVPYACKVQNAGTKQEWLRYGRGEVLADLLKISESFTSVLYRDNNVGEDTGSFDYKMRGQKKWKNLVYKPADYSRNEAVQKAWETLIQMYNNVATDQVNAAYFTGEDEENMKIFVKNTAGGIVGEWSFNDKQTKDKIENKIKEMKDYTECVFIAHNLARFDGSFLLNYLLSKGIEPEFIINGGRILNLKWYNSCVWDTYLFIPDSLKNIAQTFKCKVQKGDFDHTLIKNWDDVERYKEAAPNGMGWRPYLDCDVFSLTEIVETYTKNVHQTFGINPFKYVTLSSMTYKLWGQTTLEQNVVIETPQKEKYDFVKDAIYGGRVFPMQKHFATTAFTKDEEKTIQDIYQKLDQNISLDDIKYDPQDIKNMWQKCWDSESFISNMDMNSLYPTAMCMDYPVGLGEWSSNPERDFAKGFIGIYHISWEAPKNIIMAILPQRNKPFVSGTGLTGDKLENKRWKSSGIKWSLESAEGVYTSVDIELAIKHGYKIKFLERAMIWKERAKIFKTYIQEIYKIKKQQDGFENTPEYNPILRMIAKNMMNSLFGKTCQKPVQDEQKILKEEKDFYEFVKNYELTDYVWVKLKEKNVLAVSGSPADVENTKPSHLGAFVLAYSRKIMTEDFDRVTHHMKDCTFTYTDTDSIHMSGAAYKEMLREHKDRFGPEIGQFSNDIKGIEPLIIYEYCLAPKCYMYIYITQDGKVGMKKKVKGLPKQIMKKISMEDYANEKAKTLNFDSMKRNMFNKEGYAFTIQNTVQERTFLKNKWAKMNYIPELKQFRPFGYDQPLLDMLVFLAKEDKEISEQKEEKVEEISEQKEISELVTNEYGHRLYETKLPDKWYFRQAPALKMPKSRLVCWLNEIGFNKKQTRHYTRLEVKDMLDVLYKSKDVGAYLYEVTDEDPTRLFCDIDLERKTTDDTEPKEILDQVCKCIVTAAQTFGVTIDIAQDMKILSACTEKKFSFHMSSNKHIFPTPQHQQCFWKAVAEVMKQFPKLYVGDQPAVDLPIYHKHRCMRTIYSRKPNKQILEPVDIDLNVLNISKEEIESYFIIHDVKNIKNYSLLSRAPDLKKIKRSVKGNYIVKNSCSLSQDVQDLLLKNKAMLQGFDLEHGEMDNNILRLNRVGESKCCSCHRNHSSENGFIKLCSKPYFICFRNKEEKIYLET